MGVLASKLDVQMRWWRFLIEACAPVKASGVCCVWCTTGLEYVDSSVQLKSISPPVARKGATFLQAAEGLLHLFLPLPLPLPFLAPLLFCSPPPRFPFASPGAATCSRALYFAFACCSSVRFIVLVFSFPCESLLWCMSLFFVVSSVELLAIEC